MPITLTQLKNPWATTQTSAPGQTNAGATEAQRADLFTVDFSSAYAAIRGVLERERDTGGVAELLDQLPIASELIYYARAVDFGEAKVASQIGRRHEATVPYPGLEEPYGAVTVNFIQDASGDANRYASKIMAFFRAWRALVRAGRAGLNSGDISLGLLQASASGRGLVPHYRHNFNVKLWRGAVPGSEEEPALTLELATQWTLQGAWVLAVQPGSVGNTNNGAQELRVVFAVETLTEGLGGGVRILAPLLTTLG